jgi:hypothetical protein
MTQSNMIDRADAPRGYGLKVTFATLSASVAAGAFWASQNPQIARHDLWQDGAIAAGLLALLLTWSATKRTPRGAPEPRARQASRPSLVRTGLDAASTLRSQIVEASKAEAAKATEAKETAKPSALETERARLRKDGFSDPEISQILIARETGAANRTSFGSGVATGLLNNLDAIVTHVRGLVPNLKSDLARILDRDAEGAARIGGALSLSLKAAAIVVVGYFVYLEALQFRASAYKAWAEACIQRQQNAINFSTMSELMSGNTPDRTLDRDCGTR